jgi:hypothetical protein
LEALAYSFTFFRKHMNMHKKSFKCPVFGCRGSFGRNSDLQRHNDSIHKRELKFRCERPECVEKEVGFTRKDHLTQHMSKHSTFSLPISGSGIPEVARTRLASPPRKRRRRFSGEASDEKGSSPDEGLKMKKLRAENARLQELVNKQAESICALTSRK